MRRISILNSDVEVPVGDCKSPTISANPFASIPARRAGFTLIELMIVVAIVGILAAIVYPAFMAQMRKGHRAAAQLHMMNIACARDGTLSMLGEPARRTVTRLAQERPGYLVACTIIAVVPAIASPPTSRSPQHPPPGGCRMGP
jgi:prepilin-type N-terminal cleavage/methylation domain-containing protein